MASPAQWPTGKTCADGATCRSVFAMPLRGDAPNDVEAGFPAFERLFALPVPDWASIRRSFPLDDPPDSLRVREHPIDTQARRDQTDSEGDAPRSVPAG